MTHSLNDKNLARQIIMDHYENPRNHELTDDSRYLLAHMNSESCIDDIKVQALIENDVIKDFRFDGVACTISTASTSILSELLIDKTISEAKEIIDNYRSMLFEREFNSELLEEAVIFQNVSKQPNRIKCATIGVDGIEEIFTKVSDNNG